MRIRIGWWLAFILAVFPVVYLFMLDPSRFSSLSTGLNTVGKVLGLAGMVVFSITLTLHTRLLFLERLFGGLDKVYKAHHIFGTTAFLLLLFHPLVLASMFALSSLQNAALFLLPGPSTAVNFGILALVSMMLFLFITFFVSLPYQHWKHTHQFLGYAFIFASIHVFLIPSDVAVVPALRWYFIFFMVLGIAAFTYRKFLWKFLGRRRACKVTQVKPLSAQVTEITLAPIGKFRFVPGQFCFVSYQDRKFKEWHPFTISSGSQEPVLRFSIKKLGEYTGRLPELRKGTDALVEGPFGNFCPSLYSNKIQVWIAGGIGITPFLSMARSLAPQDTRKIHLYWSVVSEEEAIFLEELRAVEKRCRGFKVIPHFTKTQGYLSIDRISGLSGIERAEIFLCGPLPMMLSLKKQCIMKGIRRSRMHTEEFSL